MVNSRLYQNEENITESHYRKFTINFVSIQNVIKTLIFSTL